MGPEAHGSQIRLRSDAHARKGAVSESRLEKSRRCMLCEMETVEQFLDLGSTALANKVPLQRGAVSPRVRYPPAESVLSYLWHVQLTESRSHQAPCFEEYLYISSASDTLKTHFCDLSDLLVQRYHLGAADLVIDIGCNDGTLLHGYKRHGIQTLGVDPQQTWRN